MGKNKDEVLVGEEKEGNKVSFESPERTVHVFFGTTDGASMGSGVCYIPENSSNQKHTHYEEDEVIFVLKGKIEFVFPDYQATLEPFQSIYIPKNVEHQIFNVGTGEAAHTFTFSPSGAEEKIRNKYR